MIAGRRFHLRASVPAVRRVSVPGATMTRQPRNEPPTPAAPADRPEGSSASAADDPTPDRLLSSVEDDRDRRWQAGDRRPAEAYLAAHPPLAADPECVLQLAYGEYLFRERLGEAPSAEEYLRRFPHVADRFRQQVELHLALGGPAEFAPD